VASSVNDEAALNRLEDANFHHLVGDIGWFGLAIPAVGSFFSVFAIRLGATALHLGLLSSLPAVLMLVSSVLSNWWRARYPDSVKAVFWPTFIMRVRLLFFVLAPLLPAAWQAWSLVIVMAAVSIPMGIANIIFLVMMRETIREGRFTALISRRQLVLNLCVAGSTLVTGFWLERVAFPLNYQILFVAGFGLMMVSLWHVARLVPFNVTPEPKPDRADPDSRPWHSPRFRTLALMVTALFVGFTSMQSLISLRLVEDLGAAEDFIALYSFLELISAATGSTFANRLIKRFGHRRVVLASMTSTASAALILALAPSQILALPAAVLSGATWVMVDITQFSFFSARTPAEKRTSYTRAYFQTLAIATFIGPLIGSTLADQGVSLPAVMLVGAGLRLTAGVIFYRGGGRLEHMPAH
jgi:MFS family permease